VIGLKAGTRQQSDEKEPTTSWEEVVRLRYLVVTLLQKNEQLRQQLSELVLANSQIFSSGSQFSGNADSSNER
jgi:hypothetical protein